MPNQDAQASTNPGDCRVFHVKILCNLGDGQRDCKEIEGVPGPTQEAGEEHQLLGVSKIAFLSDEALDIPIGVCPAPSGCDKGFAVDF
jgi:hypothetical protein